MLLGIVGGVGEGESVRDVLIVDVDNGDAAELHALEPMHRGEAHAGLRGRSVLEHHRGEPGGMERLGHAFESGLGPHGDGDVLLVDPTVDPLLDLSDQCVELLAAGAGTDQRGGEPREKLWYSARPWRSTPSSRSS